MLESGSTATVGGWLAVPVWRTQNIKANQSEREEKRRERSSEFRREKEGKREER